MKSRREVSLEVRREVLYRRIQKYTWQGFEVVSETDTEAELIGHPEGGCLIDVPLNLMVFLSAPIFYILTAPFAWLLSRPFALLLTKIRRMLEKLGFKRTETVVVVTLSVDEVGRVHEHRRLRDLK